ncbi:MAG TPA: preprotein translocase subunit SecE [Gaiellales bacterium]|jgi:preprotein translocase subunit SecE|nr:preprotein translocase subunit SecE [Gaiellales bacterium]
MARTSRRNRQAVGRRTVTAPVAGKPKSQSGGDIERRGGLRGGLSGLGSFAGEVRAELGKVDFPNRQQTWQSTLVVLAACLIVGAYLYGLDQVFARLATRLVDLQK